MATQTYPMPFSSPPKLSDFLRQQQAATEQFDQDHPFAPSGWVPRAPSLSIGEQNARDNAPAAPSDPLAVPQAALPFLPAQPGGVMPAPLSIAAGLMQSGQDIQMASYQQRLRDAGINLSTEGRNPADVARAQQGAIGVYNTMFGAKPSASVAPAGIQTFAPTDLRAKLLANNGQAQMGTGDVAAMATGVAPSGVGPDGRALPVWQQNQLPGNRFELKQIPPEGGFSEQALSYVTPTAKGPTAPQPSAPAAQQQPASAPQTPYDQAVAALTPSNLNNAVTAPDGSIFVRDKNGRLQAAGKDPKIAAQVEAQTEAAKTEAKASVEDAHKMLDSVATTAESANNLIQNIDRINSLYKAGATSGLGQGALTTMAAALSRISGKEVKVAKQQELEKLLGQVALEKQKEIAKGQGAVSNYERDLFQAAQANKNLTPTANRQILNALANVAKRQVALHDERIRLEDMGLDSVKIAKELRSLNKSLIEQDEAAYSAQPAAGGAAPKMTADDIFKQAMAGAKKR